MIIIIVLLIVLRVSSEDKEQTCRMLLHALQIIPQSQYKTLEFEKFVNISDQGETVQAFPVVVRNTLFSTLINQFVWKETFILLTHS